MSLGYIHSIETFGTVDGPGTRLVVFFSGCQLGCAFCHNPDTWQTGDKQMSVDEIMTTYDRYQGFYRKGGLTCSGGEPLLQGDFLRELLQKAKEKGIHTVVDTSGFAPTENLKNIIPYVDHFLFSIKSLKQEKHLFLTKQSNDLILENLRVVLQSDSYLTLRYVVIPGITDKEEDLLLLKNFLAQITRPYQLEILPYHLLGKAKWEVLNLPYLLEGIPPASSADVDRIKSFLGVK